MRLCKFCQDAVDDFGIRQNYLSEAQRGIL